MALVPLSTRKALQRQFEVLADLLFPVDNNLGEVLKDLGRQFEDDAKATILYLNQALKDVPRTRNESRVIEPLVAASNDAVREYFRSRHGVEEDETLQLVKLLKSVECKEDKVKEITQSFEKYSANPSLFWTSFSSLHAGNSIQQTVSAIEHHSSSSPLARRLLCRRLTAQIESKAQELEKQGHALRIGMSYRNLALRLSVGQDWKKHRSKLREGERWSCLDAGMLAAIKGTSWKSWGRTSKDGIRAINEYLKSDPVTSTYQVVSATIQAIQDCFGPTVHACTTPMPSITRSISQESVTMVLPVSPHPPTGDHRDARTKRRRLCRESDGDTRNGQRTRSSKRCTEYGRRGDREDSTGTLEIQFVQPGKCTSADIPPQQEGSLNPSCDIEVASQQSGPTQQIDSTSFLPQMAEQTAVHERDGVQRSLLPGAEQGSIGNEIAITPLHSQGFPDRDLMNQQPFPNSDPCWTFPNFDSGWTHDTLLVPVSNSDPNFFYSY
ncbi:hypothetical protein BDQ94DRAFT_164557 [Aspergillus welwitschiae]|uniref:Uncharacterized protein n=1 Tax=Aspergillus welwitschiae TaxID=1341132 RepID=A0A3F3PJ20_9EURO|nr:hypothetical protein BDQ94DRAFT_164557 [Aspergillus welwitschiae]RDH26356.1 hypothetical protein BDQ94DRAFT_164557 [Aspergillus welwitschiae]